MCRLYNTWRKAKDTFVKPKLRVYFGTWKSNPYAFGIWPILYICPHKLVNKYCYTVHNSVQIKTGTVIQKFGDTEYPINQYIISKHALPGNLRDWDYVWKRDIRKGLKRLHLNWLKPYYHLPPWLCFKIANFDVRWKDKYDSPRYEAPPRLSVVIFGLSLTFSLHCPTFNEYACDDQYWEAIFWHLYYNKSGNLKETVEKAGIWHRMSDDIRYFAIRPEYIVKEKQEEYYAAVSDIRAKNEDTIY